MSDLIALFACFSDSWTCVRSVGVVNVSIFLAVLTWLWLVQILVSFGILMSLYTELMPLFLGSVTSVDSIDGGAISEILQH